MLTGYLVLTEQQPCAFLLPNHVRIYVRDPKVSDGAQRLGCCCLKAPPVLSGFRAPTGCLASTIDDVLQLRKLPVLTILRSAWEWEWSAWADLTLQCCRGVVGLQVEGAR